mmetsp:Transcript_87896/g.169176  ORF Transcript_87896/g.169176 Transcript_87896/m.169176 type:complete len:260 (-) Transcript_87896:29-808(-)
MAQARTHWHYELRPSQSNHLSRRAHWPTDPLAQSPAPPGSPTTHLSQAVATPTAGPMAASLQPGSRPLWQSWLHRPHSAPHWPLLPLDLPLFAAWIVQQHLQRCCTLAVEQLLLSCFPLQVMQWPPDPSQCIPSPSHLFPGDQTASLQQKDTPSLLRLVLLPLPSAAPILPLLVQGLHLLELRSTFRPRLAMVKRALQPGLCSLRWSLWYHPSFALHSPLLQLDHPLFAAWVVRQQLQHQCMIAVRTPLLSSLPLQMTQ